jgi:pimeloyl-ACP methyl ester carboxylesterase
LSLRPASFIAASTDLVATQGEKGEPAQYEDLTVPVGILFGAGDRILDPAVHGKGFAAKVKGAELELIEGGGHMIPVTSADRSAAFIVRLAERSVAAGHEVAPAVQG